MDVDMNAVLLRAKELLGSVTWVKDAAISDNDFGWEGYVGDGSTEDRTFRYVVAGSPKMGTPVGTFTYGTSTAANIATLRAEAVLMKLPDDLAREAFAAARKATSV